MIRYIRTSGNTFLLIDFIGLRRYQINPFQAGLDTLINKADYRRSLLIRFMIMVNQVGKACVGSKP